MILNSLNCIETYKTKHNKVMNYLVIEKHIPIFRLDKSYYYFVINDTLEEALAEMPLELRFISLFK